MSEDSYGFSQAKVRLEEIVSQVRKKDTSLEKSLDLLEEGVRLANRCTELIDQADWDAAASSGAADAAPGDESGAGGAGAAAPVADDAAIADDGGEEPGGGASQQDAPGSEALGG